MTKKKHYIKTIDDIKYCEEHKRLVLAGVYSDSYKFEDGVWNRYDSDGNLDYYNIGISTTDGLYYYEEESEEQTEATEKNIGKLCWFWDNNEEIKTVSTLLEFNKFSLRMPYRATSGLNYMSCRPLTKAEIQEFMEKADE